MVDRSLQAPGLLSTNWAEIERGIILMSFCSCLIRYSGHSNQLPVVSLKESNKLLTVPNTLCKINPVWNVWGPLLRLWWRYLSWWPLAWWWAGDVVPVSVHWHWRHFPWCPALALACSWSALGASRYQVLSGITRGQLSSRLQDQDISRLRCSQITPDKVYED